MWTGQCVRHQTLEWEHTQFSRARQTQQQWLRLDGSMIGRGDGWAALKRLSCKGPQSAPSTVMMGSFFSKVLSCRYVYLLIINNDAT